MHIKDTLGAYSKLLAENLGTWEYKKLNTQKKYKKKKSKSLQ